MLTRLFEGSVDRQSVLLALGLTIVVAWIAALFVQRLAGAGLHALGRDRLAESATHFHGPVRLLGSGTFLLVFGVLLFPAFQIVGLHPRTGIDLRSLAEWMFDRLPTLAHGFWVCIKPLLHGLEQLLVIPSCNSPLWPRRALRFERTILTGRGPVAPQHLAVFFACVAISQPLPSWTAVGVLAPHRFPHRITGES